MKKFYLLLCVSAVCLSASANHYTVTTSASSGDNSLLASITAAANGDTINFNFDGTQISLTDAIVMKSLVIDGNNVFNGKKIILKQTTGSKSFFTLASGIQAKLSNMVFDSTSVLGNTAITAANGSTLNIDNCIFKNINAQANNGGAARIQGVANITNTSFEGNISNGGYGGGALCIYNAADVTIDKCSFIGNKSNINGTNKNGGGAIVARATATNPCNVTITNSTFANNTAGLTGGAVMASVQSSSDYTVNVKAINCTFTGNTGTGAICAHTTVKGHANVLLVNSIVVNNVSADGTAYSDINETVGTDPSTVAVVSVNNVLYAAAPTIVTTGKNCIQVADPSTADVFKTYETFSTDKKRPALSTVGINTVAMISETSLAKNAGTATLSGSTIPTVDQLGEVRPTTPSMGAVEYKLITRLPQEKASEISWFVKNHNLVLSGISEPTFAKIYNLQGNLVKKVRVDQEASISLDNISGNLFLVRVGNATFKVLVH